MRGILAAVSFATACVAPAVAHAQEFVYDPFEGLNRRLFAVHEAIDEAVLEPVARGYRAVTPRPVRRGVSNFLRNLRAPVTFVNDVLQGEVVRAGTTAARFGLNSTVGVFGVLDPATEIGLQRHEEDFGQTLAVWGVPSGPYLFVPLLGPTNFRDGSGKIVDIAFDPITWSAFEGEDAFRFSRAALTGMAAREGVLEAIDDVRDNSVDPYVNLRTSYGLWRYSAIQNGRRDVQDLPEFEEIPEIPAEEPSTLDNGATEPEIPSGDVQPAQDAQNDAQNFVGESQ